MMSFSMILKQGSSNFTVRIWQCCKVVGTFCCSFSSVLLEQESHLRQKGNKWVQECFNKTLFISTILAVSLSLLWCGITYESWREGRRGGGVGRERRKRGKQMMLIVNLPVDLFLGAFKIRWMRHKCLMSILWAKSQVIIYMC